MGVVGWPDLAAEAPQLARTGRDRLHGRVAYLATTRRSDGSPRVHPVTPVVARPGLFLFMESTSPKGHDLGQDPRYALHCGVEDNSGGAGEFFVRGIAELVEDPAVRQEVVSAAPYSPAARYVLFRLLLAEATFRTYRDGRVVQESWTAG